MTMLQHGSVPSTGGYQIERSLRFNSADSAYLNRTPASAGNRKKWTWSGWVKRSALTASTYFQLFCARTSGSPYDFLYFYNDGLSFETSVSLTRVTTQVFRDPSAWYHIMVAVDTTQATANDRAKIYVNGSQITAFNTITNCAQDADLATNSTVNHWIGASPAGEYYNGYMADVYLIDGSALTPSSFGENDTDTGVWKPKAYSGTYGTNGFYLKFADNSGTTSTTLGKDSSGNGNNWTPNNFSVTAGAGNDSLVDTPTPYGTDTGAGGEVRGNYCALNPLDKHSELTASNGNLDLVAAISTTVWRATRATFGMSSGKWYWEVLCNNITSGGGSPSAMLGIMTSQAALTNYVGSDAYGWGYYSVGDKYTGGSGAGGGIAGYQTGDVIGFAFDAGVGTLTFYKNGVSVTSFTGLSANTYFPAFSLNGTSAGSITVNFGQRPFAYTAPSGFKALCTTNLPTPAIGATSTTRADKYFDATLFTGTGAALSVVNAGGFQPDLVWTKRRDAAGNNLLANVLSGVDKYLISESTAAEATGAQLYTSFNSNGFSMGTSGYANGATVVAWQWKANGAGSSNTQGTITSTVSANTTSGFSVVTYTGNGTNGATVGHGLGVSPGFVIVKRRNAAGDNWPIWHTSLGNNAGAYLNSTNASYSSSTHVQSVTSSTFTIGVDTDVNANGGTYVAYVFSPVAGYSAFGSYTGNGSTDGPFIYLGFRPRFLLVKAASSGLTESWQIVDTSRDSYNVSSKALFPNLSNAEVDASSVNRDILSNGFKIRSSDSNQNSNGGTYIYAAFAENPFKYSLAR